MQRFRGHKVIQKKIYAFLLLYLLFFACRNSQDQNSSSLLKQDNFQLIIEDSAELPGHLNQAIPPTLISFAGNFEKIEGQVATELSTYGLVPDDIDSIILQKVELVIDNPNPLDSLGDIFEYFSIAVGNDQESAILLADSSDLKKMSNDTLSIIEETNLKNMIMLGNPKIFVNFILLPAEPDLTIQLKLRTVFDIDVNVF